MMLAFKWWVIFLYNITPAHVSIAMIEYLAKLELKNDQLVVWPVYLSNPNYWKSLEQHQNVPLWEQQTIFIEEWALGININSLWIHQPWRNSEFNFSRQSAAWTHQEKKKEIMLANNIAFLLCYCNSLQFAWMNACVWLSLFISLSSYHFSLIILKWLQINGNMFCIWNFTIKS